MPLRAQPQEGRCALLCSQTLFAVESKLVSINAADVQQFDANGPSGSTAAALATPMNERLLVAVAYPKAANPLSARPGLEP